MYNRGQDCVSASFPLSRLSGKAQPEKQLRSSGRRAHGLKLIPIVEQMGGRVFFSPPDGLTQ